MEEVVVVENLDVKVLLLDVDLGPCIPLQYFALFIVGPNGERCDVEVHAE